MSNVLKPGTAKPQEGQTLSQEEGSLKAKHIDKLPPEERKWSDNVLRVLKIPQKGSQSRVLAGAIATSESIIQSNDYDPQIKQQVKDLLDVVLAAGTPPWKDTKKAMRAMSAKVELDLLSLPADNQKLAPFKAGNVNPTFWINRTDADGQTRNAFLCKKPSPDQQVGLPPGGEVIREALVGRAAQTFTSITGLDVNMPETHVVSVPQKYLPQGNNPTTGNVLCSVQEARESQGDIKDLGSMQQLTLDSEQVAALAIFDTMTLNSDRHPGNLLVDNDKKLIPIDHGYSLVEPGEGGDGNARISAAMAGPNNAMLRIPGAHQPMSAKMLKKLKVIDPDSFAKSLKKDRDQIAEEHPDMAQMVSDQALESARRSAWFVKLAAKNKPPLSPAAIQTAFGGNASILLDPEIKKDSEFVRLAKAVIDRAAPRQEIVKQICTASAGQYNAMAKKAEDLGWWFQVSGEATDFANVSDPLLLCEIVTNGIKRNNKKKLADQIKEILANMLPPDQAKQKLLELKLGLIQEFSQILTRDERNRINEERFRVTSSGSVEDQLHYANLLLESTFSTAHRVLLDRLKVITDEYATNKENNWLNVALRKQDLTEIKVQVETLEESVNKRELPTLASFALQLQRLKGFVQTYEVAKEVYLKDTEDLDLLCQVHLDKAVFDDFKNLVDRIETDIQDDVIKIKNG